MEDLERRAEALDTDRDDATLVWMHEAPRFHDQSIYERVGKPVMDRLAGILLTIATLPLVLVIVPLIWSQMGRPAIYEQRRVGRLGREFTVYKFRTMLADRRSAIYDINHADRRINHKSDADPRHTDLGRYLRKWSLDEIPQLWNVALGNMSLIGPRPELPHVVAKYEPWQHRRHEVKPGLTGLWQVTARGDTPMHEATDIDVDYVENIGFLGDLSIIVRTPFAVLGSNQGR